MQTLPHSATNTVSFRLPGGFKADDKLVAAAEECIAELNLNAVRGLIVSGDAFINGSVGTAKIRHNFPQAIAVEMEATAIAHVCHNFNVPFVVVRAISDVADQQSHISFDEFRLSRQNSPP